MSYYSNHNRRKSHNYYTYYDKYYDEKYHIDYDDYSDYCNKYDICDCYKEMKRLLKSLEGHIVFLATKNAIITLSKILCVSDNLVTYYSFDRRANFTSPIAQVVSVSGPSIECACRKCCYCKKTMRKECCCGECELRQFLEDKTGLVTVFHGYTAAAFNLELRCITDQLAIFKFAFFNSAYIAIPLCCIINIKDENQFQCIPKASEIESITNINSFIESHPLDNALKQLNPIV